MSVAIIFFKNLLSLVKSMMHHEIVWNWNTKTAHNCHIDTKSKLYPPYALYNVTIGLGTYVSSNARIADTRIGNFCSIGPNFLCGWGIHPLTGVSTNPAFYSSKKQSGFSFCKEDKFVERRPIEIGNDVFIGANVFILDGVIIGDGVVIGAGAIVNKDIPAYSVAVGCPIKIIKKRFNDEIITNLMKIQWWNLEEESLQQVEKYFYDVEQFIIKMNEPYSQYFDSDQNADSIIV